MLTGEGLAFCFITIWQIILIFRDVKRAAVRRGSSDLYFLYMAGTGVGRLLSQA